jgi:hypothetical protein
VLWDTDGDLSKEAKHVSLVVSVSSDGKKIRTVGGNENRRVADKQFTWRTYSAPGAGKVRAFVSPAGG